MKSLKDIATNNTKLLKENVYPGRGIIIGSTPDSKNLVQVYWIMGRSENSRNRIFVENNDSIMTKPWDISKVKDPSLIIYNVTRVHQNTHILSNGDQTDTIYNFISESKSFESALDTRYYEPDKPNYTPRISGIIDLDNGEYAYKLSILKSLNNTTDSCIRNTFTFEKPVHGFGHCIHTYANDGDPLPSFEGEPYITPIYDDIEKTCFYYWDLLNNENKISLFVKFINIETKKYKTTIINSHEKS